MHSVSTDPSNAVSGDDSATEISATEKQLAGNAVTRKERDQRALRSIAWTGASRYAGQLFRWASTFLVARLLSPEDYGLIGMTALFSGVVALLAEFGVSASVIKMRDLDDLQLAQLNGLAVLLGAFAMLVGCVSAWPIAWFFHRKELLSIVAVSSLGFLLTSVQTVPSALLQRATNFRAIAGIEFAGALLLASLTLAMAATGFGYWALVIPTLAVGLMNSWRFWLRVRVGFSWPQIDQVREAYRYSIWVLTGRLSGYFSSNADVMIVGRLFGSTDLGAYSLAWDLANTPNDQINGLIARVSAPYYSELQHDRREGFRLFALMLEGVSFLSLPLVFGMAAVAPEFVAFALGPKWDGAVTILQLLCLVAALRVSTILINPLMAMMGDAKYQARVSFVSLFLMPPLQILGGSLYGMPGIAIAWLIGYPLVMAALFRRVAKQFSVSAWSIVYALAPATLSCGAMVAVVLGVKWYLPLDLGLATRFALLVLAGALVYATMILTFFSARIAAFRLVVAGSFGRQGATAM